MFGNLIAAVVGGLTVGVLSRWAVLRSGGLTAADTATASGWTITSNIRTPAHNARVGGHAQSRHLIGLAWDFLPRPGGVGALREIFTKHLPPGTRVVVLDERDHYHVQIG